MGDHRVNRHRVLMEKINGETYGREGRGYRLGELVHM